MKRGIFVTLASVLLAAPAGAQNHSHPNLHVSTRWKECSIQLDPALTQTALHQFTEEAGLVVYFRPLADARPLGRGRFEVSALKWKTGIDDHDAAWNDTFVHPDDEHWLFEGSGQEIPGLMARVGVTSNTDVGVYFTKSPGANYGFFGAQLQRALVDESTRGWAASTRLSFVSLYGPEDLSFTVYGVDLVTSRTVLRSRWVSLSPYAGVSTYLGSSHEKSAVVDLNDERVLGAQATIGTALSLSKARLAVEYNVAKVNSFSFKVGVGI
jgi:hypothetical protein